MHIDEALDRLGAHRFPAEWGQSPVWENHPFRYEEAAKRFCSYRARRNDAGLWQFDRVPLTAVYDDVALRLADQRYKEAVAELSEALERGFVKASLVGRSRDPEPVSVTSLIWTRQNVGIFVTGYRYFGRVKGKMGGEDRQLILIERATFDDWLDPSARVSRSPKSLSNRAVTEILEVLTAHASETGMKYKRD
jgi:hypothetical protein